MLCEAVWAVPSLAQFSGPDGSIVGGAKKAAEILKEERQVTRRLLIREVPHLNRV